MLCMDKGLEFILLVLVEWVKKYVVKLVFIQLGKLKKNVFIECFNWIYCIEIFNFYLFRMLNEVWEIMDKGLLEYNCECLYELWNNMILEEYC